MSRSLMKNFLYNLLLQVVTLFVPLVMVPYTSRVLGKEGIGVYSYTFSMTQYFVIFGTLGISLYGSRQIAYVRDDREKMSQQFWAITLLKIITTSISLVVYMLIYSCNSKYYFIYLIQSINIIAAMIDISWFYIGIEDFKKTVTRNLIVKILGLICIFIFVKSYDDLYKYIAINAIMIFSGNLVMWMYLPKLISKVKIKLSDITGHILPAINLFIPQVAIQIYVVLDKSMLGILANTSDVGLYDQSERIVKFALSLITSLGMVMLPRMSNAFSKGDNKILDDYLNKSLLVVVYVATPMAFGLASISKEFAPWFLGKSFSEATNLIIILAPIMLFIAISNVLGVQYLLPTNKTKEFTMSVIIGAMLNIILNFILIPRYKATGSCIATVIAEFFVTFVQYIFIRKNIKNKIFLLNLIKYIVVSIIMVVLVRFIGDFMKVSVETTIVQCVIGSLFYITALSLLKDNINVMIFKKIYNTLVKKLV